jgi:hypothetical protein
VAAVGAVAVQRHPQAVLGARAVAEEAESSCGPLRSPCAVLRVPPVVPVARAGH